MTVTKLLGYFCLNLPIIPQKWQFRFSFMTRTHPKVSGKSHQTTGSLKWQEWQISVNLTVGGIQHRPISAIILYQDKLHQKENLVARNFAIKVFALTSLLAQSNDIQESLKLDLGKISRCFSLEQDCWIWKKKFRQWHILRKRWLESCIAESFFLLDFKKLS